MCPHEIYIKEGIQPFESQLERKYTQMTDHQKQDTKKQMKQTFKNPTYKHERHSITSKQGLRTKITRKP